MQPINPLHKKMDFFTNHFCIKCDEIRRKLPHLVSFTEEIFNGRHHFLGCKYLYFFWPEDITLVRYKNVIDIHIF